MNPSLTTPRILWLALLTSQGIYLGILQMPGVIPAVTTPDPVMLYALAPMALLALIASFVLPSVLFRSAPKTPLSTVETAGAVSEGYRRPAGTAHAFADRDAALREGLRVGMSPFIVGLALNESVAIFGLVLGFLGHPLWSYLPFFVVAWLAMLARFPTERFFLRPVAEANAVRL